MQLIDFEWGRYTEGYEIIEKAAPDEGNLDFGREYVVPKGDGTEIYRPLDVPGLYRILAQTPLSASGAVQFCNRFGSFQRSPETNVLRFTRAVRDMRHALDLADAEKWDELIRITENDANTRRLPGLGRSSVTLAAGSSGRRPMFALRPMSLQDAIWLQFVRDKCNGVNLHSCQVCDEVFEVGPGTGRRKTARFCSDKCRYAYHAREGAKI